MASRKTLIARHQHAGPAELQARADRLSEKVAATTSEKTRAALILEIQVIGELQETDRALARIAASLAA